MKKKLLTVIYLIVIACLCASLSISYCQIEDTITLQEGSEIGVLLTDGAFVLHLNKEYPNAVWHIDGTDVLTMDMQVVSKSSATFLPKKEGVATIGVLHDGILRTCRVNVAKSVSSITLVSDKTEIKKGETIIVRAIVNGKDYFNNVVFTLGDKKLSGKAISIEIGEANSYNVSASIGGVTTQATFRTKNALLTFLDGVPNGIKNGLLLPLCLIILVLIGVIWFKSSVNKDVANKVNTKFAQLYKALDALRGALTLTVKNDNLIRRQSALVEQKLGDISQLLSIFSNNDGYETEIMVSSLKEQRRLIANIRKRYDKIDDKKLGILLDKIKETIISAEEGIKIICRLLSPSKKNEVTDEEKEVALSLLKIIKREREDALDKELSKIPSDN